MDKYEIQLSMKAKNDLKSIIKYIKYELLEPTIALKYAQMIRQEIKKLEYLPKKFATISPEIIKYNNVRKLVIKNYIAFYRIDENEKIVNIDRILYGSAEWKNKL